MEKAGRGLEHPQHEITIAMVGKYVDLTDSTSRSTRHSSTPGSTRAARSTSATWIGTIEKEGIGALLKGVSAILVPGGFGKRASRNDQGDPVRAREQDPYLGICLGMQLAVIEFARNVVGLAGANSTEFDARHAHPVIALVTEWQDRDGRVERRDEEVRSRGTMRLGAQGAALESGSLAAQVYGADVINERHRHRYEVNNSTCND